MNDQAHQYPPPYVRRVRRYKLEPWASRRPDAVAALGKQRELAVEVAWWVRKHGWVPQVDHCERCGARIYWTAWGGFHDGLAVDVEPHQDGRVQLAIDRQTKVLKAKIMADGEQAPRGRNVYRPHLDTCPSSEDLGSRLARRDRLVEEIRATVADAVEIFDVEPGAVRIEITTLETRTT